jgi:drug/metabolite transporter (DMT)-like permease
MGPAEWSMLFALSIIWGGSFFFFAVAIRELPTLSIVLARIGLGAAALWLAVMALGIALQRDRGVWRDLLIMGIFNNAIPFSLIVWGQREVASGLAAVINGTTPFFTVLIANAFTADEKMSWNRLASCRIVDTWHRFREQIFDFFAVHGELQLPLPPHRAEASLSPSAGVVLQTNQAASA